MEIAALTFSVIARVQITTNGGVPRPDIHVSSRISKKKEAKTGHPLSCNYVMYNNCKINTTFAYPRFQNINLRKHFRAGRKGTGRVLFFSYTFFFMALNQVWTSRRQHEWCTKIIEKFLLPPACTILGVKLVHPGTLLPSTTISRAFRTKSLAYHPDRHDQNDPRAQERATAQMAKLNQARETLISLEQMHAQIEESIGCIDDAVARLDPLVSRNIEAGIVYQQKSKLVASYDAILEHCASLSGETYTGAFRDPASAEEDSTEFKDPELTNDSVSSLGSLSDSLASPLKQSPIQPPRAESQMRRQVVATATLSSATDLANRLNLLCAQISKIVERETVSSCSTLARIEKAVAYNGSVIDKTLNTMINGNRNTINAPFNTIYGKSNTIRSAFNYCNGENTFSHGVFLVVVGSSMTTTASKTYFSVFIDPAIAKTKVPPNNTGGCNQYFDTIDTAIKTRAIVKHNGTFRVNPYVVVTGTAKTAADLNYRIGACTELIEYIQTEIRRCRPAIPARDRGHGSKRKHVECN